MISSLELEVKIEPWVESMLWCPSQVSREFQIGDKKFELYLRWRHSDPWQCALIEYADKTDNLSKIIWHDLDIGVRKQFCSLVRLKFLANRSAKEKLKELILI